MKKRLTIVVLLILTLVMSIPVNAAGNNWVLDEPELISAETEKYIKTVNEDVFTTYQNKPQFAVIMLNELPEGCTIDEYKLEQFNELGVGTKEENCGMLFIFVIQARQYGFEIGDGFEKGSLVRKELEKDFITADMKNLLREEKYDEVVLQITKHIEQVMEDNETGALMKKEQEEKAREQAVIKQLEATKEAILKLGAFVCIGFAGLLIIGCFAMLIKRVVKKTKVKKLLAQHQKYVSFIKPDEKELRNYLVNDTRNFVGIGYLFKNTGTLPETNDSFVESLYDYYLDKETETLRGKQLNNEFRLYARHLKKENNFDAFKEFRTKDLYTIICEVDREMERIQQIEEQNYKKIDNFVETNKNRVPNSELSLEKLSKNIKGHCKPGVLIDDETLEDVFVKELNELSFQYEYEKFIQENKDTINSRYFDSSKFYDSLRKTKEYGNYHYDRRDDFSWALPLLIIHMNNREREIRRQNEYALEQARRMQQSSSSSFGSSFGGGCSSGGGFSGGW